MLLFQILICGGEHQLNTVKLVYFAGSGVVVNGYDVALRVLVAEFFDNTLTDYVVRQTAERLAADNVGNIAVNQFHHFTG